MADDGEPLFDTALANGDIDYFAVNVESLKYFAFVLPFSIQTWRPVIQQSEDIRNGCRGTRGADVVTDDYLELFQGGGTNNFAQTVILNFAGKPVRQEAEISDVRILYIRDGNPTCLTVDDDGFLVSSNCKLGEQVSGILCFMYEGEVNTIEVEHIGCSVPPGNDQLAYLKFSVFVDVVGCGHTRQITCESFDTLNRVIDSSVEVITFGCIKDGLHFKTYEPAVVFDAQILKVSCSSLRRINSDSTIKTSHEIDIDMFQENVNLIVENDMDVGFQNHIYLKQEHYNTHYEMRFESIGYPIHVFRFSFTKLFDDISRSRFSTASMRTEREFVCGDLGDPKHLNVKAVGIKTFDNLQPRNSGYYRIQLNHDLDLNPVLVDRDRSTNCTLVHPFSIECTPTCNMSVPMSHTFKMHCVINHHVITKRSEFKFDQVPVEIKFMKYEHSPDVGFNQLSQCEFNTIVEYFLYYKFEFDHMTWNTDMRYLAVDFQLYTVQLWNEG